MNEPLRFREKTDELADRFNASEDIVERYLISHTEMPFLANSYSFQYWPRGMKSEETLTQYNKAREDEK